MSTLFDWCCRRLHRGRSLSPDGSEDGKESPEQSGTKGKGERPSRASKSVSSDGKSKKKKSDKQAGKAVENQASDGLVDLSVVKREHEVLRPYKKPPPPKNRARANRVPRALKTVNSYADHDVLQEFEETYLQKDPGISAVDDGSSAEHLPTADNLDRIPAVTDEDTAAAIAKDSARADLQETKDDSEDEGTLKSPEAHDEEEGLETVAVEPAPESGAEETFKTEELASGHENGGDFDESLQPETEAETKDSGNDQAEDDISPDRTDGGNGIGDEGNTGDGEGAGNSDDPGQHDMDDASTEPDASCANDAAAEEDAMHNVSPRSATSSKHHSPAAQQTPSKGRRFPIPSVHGDGMDQLMESLQLRLKQDGISLDDKASDKEGPETAGGGGRPLSEIIRPKDRQLDMTDEGTAPSSSGDQPEEEEM